MTRPRDSQRNKVYTWEHNSGMLPKSPDISESDTLRLVDAVVRAYGLRAVSVRWGGLRTYLGRASYSRITLWKGVPRYVVLHELAHVVQAQKLPGCAAHGPEFMRVYLDLLQRFMGLKGLRHAGLRVARSSAVPHPVRTVRERKLKAPRKRCPKHDWRLSYTLTTKVTAKGVLVLHAAQCRVCLKRLPAVA